MKISPTVRNVLIILLVAAAAAAIPGGGRATGVIMTALSLIFFAALGWGASVFYRERRESIYLLGDRRRALIYGAIAVLAVTLTATSRLWASSAGGVTWLVLVAASIYVGVSVVIAARRY